MESRGTERMSTGAAAAKEQKVEMPRSIQRDMQARTNNRHYRIFIAVPAEEPPATGYPVIYLLDANAVFGTMTEAVRVQGRRPDKTGVVPAVIVGIGYRTDEPFDPARHRDFTMPVPESELPQSPDGKAWPEQGGAESFLAFIEDELKPAIEREFSIDPKRQTIFGHSLGGLFVLHALFNKPGSFQTYIAGSPSIHWNQRVLLEAERRFAAGLERERLDAGVLIGVGEFEGNLRIPMNDNARDMSERLSLLTSRGLRVAFREFEDEGHVSVLPVLINRAVRFALSPSWGKA
ncbi:alpha/beta hydrolase [Paenibacillus sp. MBLB4367]|uniref:alpha/beta hydrolase n=1 Tax=Paenibacillus sp. MBLB4367 TaxID=3384767 RepID=UPI0039083874